MIRAIIFDCFGVLATEGWEPYYRKHFGNNPKLLERSHQLVRQLNLGLINYSEFIDKVSILANITKDQALSVIDDNVPNQPLFDYIKSKLKPKYKIGLLSNAGDNWLAEIFSKEQLALIDDYVLSYAESIIKPEPEIYHLIAKKLAVKADECVMIDDRQKHIDGAKNTSMKAVLYQDFDQMKKELEEILAADS